MAKLIRMSEAAEPIADLPSAVDEVYSFLGPSGTFTEAALAQVPEAARQALASRSTTWARRSPTSSPAAASPR